MTSLPQSSLCERCKVLEFDDSASGWKDGTEADGFYWNYPHNNNRFDLEYCLEDSLPHLPVLRTSSRQGCNFCGLLLTALTEQDFLPWNTLRATMFYKRNTAIVKSIQDTSLGLLALTVALDLAAGDNVHKTYLHFSIDSEPGPCRSWLRLQPSPKRRALGPGNLAWLHSISGDLDRETKRLPQDLIPTRLIDVTATATSDCRLVVTGPEAPLSDTRYIALSYCWGNEEESKAQLTTQKETLEERRRGFTLAEATPIFRDAVEVARALGIRYLWVDAVCIVQDDRLDWEREAAKMSLVYRHAWLTVCAMNSASCLGHFLERPPPQHSISIPFKSRLHPGVDGAYWVRWHTMNADAKGGKEHLTLDETSRWMARGWTFQELQLSSNVLVFGKYKMHYRNSSWKFSEGSYHSGPGRNEAYCFSLESIHLGEEVFLSDWIRLMEKVSRRALTKSTDKLPSVSGMARIATQNCPEQYVAGIRKDLAHRDLMWLQQLRWKSENTTLALTAVLDSIESQEPYIAPSWSWASRTSPIVGHPQVPLLETIVVRDVEKEYKSMETNIVVAGANPFGEVSGGVMTVTGTILPLDSQQLRILDTRARYQILGVRIGTGSMATVVLDGGFGDEEESSQGLSLVLLGSCLPRRAPSQKADFEAVQAQYQSHIETIDGLGKVSTPLSHHVDTRDAQGPDVPNYTGVDEEGGRGLGSPQDYSTSEDRGDDMGNGDEATGSVQEEESEARPNTEDMGAGTDGGGDGMGSKDEGIDTDSEGFIVGSRAAYGIVIYPAKRQPGKYLRVGVWSSPDGLGYLRAQEPKMVEIV